MGVLTDRGQRVDHLAGTALQAMRLAADSVVEPLGPLPAIVTDIVSPRPRAGRACGVNPEQKGTPPPRVSKIRQGLTGLYRGAGGAGRLTMARLSVSEPTATHLRTSEQLTPDKRLKAGASGGTIGADDDGDGERTSAAPSHTSTTVLYFGNLGSSADWPTTTQALAPVHVTSRYLRTLSARSWGTGSHSAPFHASTNVRYVGGNEKPDPTARQEDALVHDTPE